MTDKSYYVYILQCSDGTLYTGLTTDLADRMEKHNQGVGAKYTRGRGPVTLLYHELVQGRSEASKREAAIKKMDRQAKISLCAKPHDDSD